LLRDGLPLYDGISGNFGVLSIHRSILKQVEIIKGSVSTLFGGGAIAGMIKFISRAPTKRLNSPHSSITRRSRNRNGNVFFSQRWKKPD
jgi:iron complex outermembrane receptor protein/outer membrane receptor for ferrienterochelin and colicins